MAKKKRRVPEVLWRLFHNRARTLADTIISLITSLPSASECRCKGRRCLGCSGDEAMSFLLRPNDPSDYRKLLTQCFVVVSDNAPPPISVFDCEHLLSQLEIVRRTIEMIMCEQPTSSNVISSAYDKYSRSSEIVGLLSCSAWRHILRRVGDRIMVYLLKHTSIFLPLPRKKYHQVAGFSVSALCIKFSKHVIKTEFPHPSLVHLGFPKKRKRDDEYEKCRHSNSFGVNVPSSSISCAGCHGRSYSVPFSRHCKKKCHRKSLSEEVSVRIGAGNSNNQGDPSRECQESSNQSLAKPRKHFREYSWQRHRKQRQSASQATVSLTPCTLNLKNKDSLCDSNTSLSSSHEKMSSQCSCCLMLQTLHTLRKSSQINRQPLFYNLECSSSVLPKNHILNSLKPNYADANALFKVIFGLSDANIAAQAMPCFHSNDSCRIGSVCLYHSIVRLLKILIRKAQFCQPSRLLDKHCVVSSLNQSANGCDGSMIEGNENETISLGKEHYGVLLDDKSPPEESHVFYDKCCKRTQVDTDRKIELSKSYCLKKQVVSFIWAVCRSIVPQDLLGNPSNWRVLRKHISKFVQLRRFEKFSLKQCMHKLKISRFPLISNKHSSCYLGNTVIENYEGPIANMYEGCSRVNFATDIVTHKILESWMFWFFSCLVVPLVQANFYVTESEHGKQEVFYYRKSIWEKFMNRAITFLKDKGYSLLNDTSLRKIISNRSFGFSRVRLCPKENGVRALANLQASSRIQIKQSSSKFQSCGLQREALSHPRRVKYRYFKSVNGVLRDLHAVLKGIQNKEPEKLGSSVFDYNDVYRKLFPFLSDLKSGSSTMPSVFIVVADVSKAFDSINQDKLVSVMTDVIAADKYHLQKSHQVICGKKSLWVRQNPILAHEDISNGPTKFTSNVPAHSLYGILVDQEWNRNIRKEELHFYLNEHVKGNVLQLNKKFYLQNVGIPQGSVLSSLLCSYYYGHLDKNVIFPFLEKSREYSTEDLPGRLNCHNNSFAALNSTGDETISSPPKYMLLRFIDDFLLISTSKKQAACFFSRLKRGFREYNCYVNEEKFGLNFNIDEIPGLTTNRVYVGEDGISFLRWSGLFINSCTLEVQADYTRYLNSHLSSSLTVCWQGKPGCHLKAKLCDYLRPKCHLIFYDSNINSAAVVRLNIYQAFLLCAMKFHCYMCSLSDICRLTRKSCMDIIQRSLRYMHKLIKKKKYCLDLSYNFRPIIEVEKEEVEWLGLTAYIRVLNRKQSRYKELISLLTFKKMAHKKEKILSSALIYAVEDSHSSVMWKIKY